MKKKKKKISYGGAIYINNTTLFLIINETTFSNCSSISGNGSAIYFINGLNIQLFRICAVGCKSAPSYTNQFAFLRTNSNQDIIGIRKYFLIMNEKKKKKEKLLIT